LFHNILFCLFFPMTEGRGEKTNRLGERRKESEGGVEHWTNNEEDS